MRNELREREISIVQEETFYCITYRKKRMELVTLRHQSGEASDGSAAMVKNFARRVCACSLRANADRNIGKRYALPS
jgi:hypothetical protein